MGLSIHYTGRIKHPGFINSLVKEVGEICQELDWKNQVIHNGDIQGISFSPEGSEPVFLTFNSEGRTLSPVNFMVRDIYDDDGKEDLLFVTSTKTQFAGPETHIVLIKLLKYISSKYLKDFTMTDESYYWETGNEKLLFQQFKRYNDALNFVTNALEDLPVVPSETPESLMDRIERILFEKLKAKKREN